MNPMQILIDTYLYFARFPLFDRIIQESFNTDREKIAGYDAFKAKVEAIPTGEHNLCPEILHYIFGVDLNRITKRVDAIGDYFLLLDYGMVETDQTQYGNTKNRFFIALTVARPFSEQEMDDAEEILITQTCYDYLQKIRDHAKQDKDCPILKFDFNGGFMPFHAEKLNNSIGWTLEISRTGHLND